ncbi:hypothetical protein IWT140_00596 [Secundilactobacillus pentosiphilus]|uniref:Uncharacterized protein n=1 Tax=Secundilactobacillus pentosiphilus TaxID=1714682 RepID=A0A1Z5IWA7_9LACO|nr:hypothetical protein [Secundilactobacillus pentosiphilus]GAX02998.1 hypothetical protein IWT140_00596 [Secundilactobacillus pentosiphilus]GAX05969.1 hypothetical protein IWT25_01294 [Secundilactobacillus pentosiphilus]
MSSMSKWFLWLLLILNVILIGFLLSMNNMAAMWMMAIIMLLDSIGSLVAVYRR